MIDKPKRSILDGFNNTVFNEFMNQQIETNKMDCILYIQPHTYKLFGKTRQWTFESSMAKCEREFKSYIRKIKKVKKLGDHRWTIIPLIEDNKFLKLLYDTWEQWEEWKEQERDPTLFKHLSGVDGVKYLMKGTRHPFKVKCGEYITLNKLRQDFESKAK